MPEDWPPDVRPQDAQLNQLIPKRKPLEFAARAASFDYAARSNVAR